MATAKNFVQTPKAEAIYPHLVKPDTKFNPDGEYSVKIALDADESEELRADLDKRLEEALEGFKEEKPKFKKLMSTRTPYSEELDDEGDETGRYIFNFKLKAKVTPKKGKPFTQKPALFNAKGKPIVKQVKVGSGSIIRVSFEPVAYFNAKDKEVGLTLRLKAVKILELVEYGAGGNANAYGFGEEEDGYDGVGSEDSFEDEEEGYDGGSDGDGDFEEEDPEF